MHYLREREKKEEKNISGVILVVFIIEKFLINYINYWHIGTNGYHHQGTKQQPLITSAIV